MPAAVLISNPSASQFTGGLFRSVATALSRSFELATEWPTNPADTAKKARHAAESGVDVVFAMGGDGVAHHVANALVGSGTALGLIPAGTTNVLARILNIPTKPLDAAEAASSLEPIPTRIVKIEAHTGSVPKTTYATFSVGVGFDADVVSVAETRPYAKTHFGGIHYARTAVGRLLSTWRTQEANLRMTCDGDRFDGVAALTQVHHPYTYFGKVALNLTDEEIDGIATLAVNRLSVLRSSEILARAVLGRKHRDGTGTALWTKYDSLLIEADPATPFQADGELLGRADRLEITPVDGALNVLRPDVQVSSPRTTTVT